MPPAVPATCLRLKGTPSWEGAHEPHWFTWECGGKNGWCTGQRQDGPGRVPDAAPRTLQAVPDTHIHVHVADCDSDEGGGDAVLAAITALREELMASYADLTAALGQLPAALDAISVDLDELATRLDSLDVDTTTEVDLVNSIAERLRGTGARIDTIATTPDDPTVPVPEPEPGEPGGETPTEPAPPTEPTPEPETPVEPTPGEGEGGDTPATPV